MLASMFISLCFMISISNVSPSNWVMHSATHFSFSWHHQKNNQTSLLASSSTGKAQTNWREVRSQNGQLPLKTSDMKFLSTSSQPEIDSHFLVDTLDFKNQRIKKKTKHQPTKNSLQNQN